MYEIKTAYFYTYLFQSKTLRLSNSVFNKFTEK